MVHDGRAAAPQLIGQLRTREGVPSEVAVRLRDEGWVVRLPTEAEWEHGARGTVGWRFPRGDEFDAGRCNVERIVSNTSLVGGVPAGASPYGALDMAGSVWEWCQSLYRPYPYQAGDGREDLEAAGCRVIRRGRVKTYRGLYPQVCDFGNLYLAYRKARKGKQGRPEVAASLNARLWPGVVFHEEAIMSALRKMLALILFLPLLAAGCGSAEPKIIYVHVTATPIAQAATEPPLPPTATSAPPPAPTDATGAYDKVPEQMDDGWQTASLAEVGINPAWMTKMLESIYTGEESGEGFTGPGGGAKYLGIHNILLVKDGRLVFEEYFYYQSPFRSHEVASVTKSFSSLWVGLAIEHGFLEKVDEKILSFFPEYLPLQGADEQVNDLTIEDLLTMRHGWECDDWDPASRTYYQNDHPLDRSDLVETILYFPTESLPGSSFSYCTSATYVLNAALTRATGMELSAFAEQYLFEPLGIESATWSPFMGGWAEIGGVHAMRPRDMAKIGLLVLQNGNWNGEQIISEDWIQVSTQEHVSLEPDQPSWGAGYGYLWRVGNPRIVGSRVRAVYALGGWQQVIAIFPKLSMVVVINGGDDVSYGGQIFEIMEQFILPAVLGY